jgi:CRP-like cAMP-binding protein
LAPLRRYLKAKLGARYDVECPRFEDKDLALEWCENQWLASRAEGGSASDTREPDAYELLQGLTPEEVRRVAGLFELKSYRQGEVLVAIGAEAREVFFIRRGCASISIPVANGTHRRLGVFVAGMAFGEVAMLDGSPRSAEVRADTDVECHVLRREDLEALETTHPHVAITLLRNMALGIARLLRKATKEVGAFDL